MKYYSTEFNILSENGFTNTYRCVMDAMRYYDSDCGVCCSQFRKAFESVINDIYNLYGYLAGCYSNKQDIDGLRYVIPEPFYDDKIIFELNNLRNIGNAYAHFNGDEVRDAYNDRLTCYVAIKEISSWLVKCKKEYPKYQAKQEAERKERKENRRNSGRPSTKFSSERLGLLLPFGGGEENFRWGLTALSSKIIAQDCSKYVLPPISEWLSFS